MRTSTARLSIMNKSQCPVLYSGRRICQAAHSFKCPVQRKWICLRKPFTQNLIHLWVVTTARTRTSNIMPAATIDRWGPIVTVSETRWHLRWCSPRKFQKGWVFKKQWRSAHFWTNSCLRTFASWDHEICAAFGPFRRRWPERRPFHYGRNALFLVVVVMPTCLCLATFCAIPSGNCIRVL